MPRTYEILAGIAALNPSVTHFLLRLYGKSPRPIAEPESGIRYEWLHKDSLQDLFLKIGEWQDEGFAVGLTSIVMTERGIQYLLMLDYSLAPAPENEEELAAKLSTFNASGDVNYRMEGYLIQSNRSYHYIGKYVTTEENFINFLGSALLFRHTDQTGFVVDDRWIGHSLKKKFGTVRLGAKDGYYPRVIREV